jgi:aspartyl-tRNA(Asn)/glutamyl-tRNA(Gln) amidotransferase subunit B
VIDSCPDEALAYQNGKTKLMGFFVGLVMRETKGKANPQVVNELLKKRLDA